MATVDEGDTLTIRMSPAGARLLREVARIHGLTPEEAAKMVFREWAAMFLSESLGAEPRDPGAGRSDQHLRDVGVKA